MHPELFFTMSPGSEEKDLQSIRVLRPEGKLIIADMHTDTWVGKLFHASRWFSAAPD
jgi:hypothetical protein